MSTPTLSAFAAPQGGFSLLRAAGRRLNMTTPTLSAFAAPQGGFSLLRAAGRRLIC